MSLLIKMTTIQTSVDSYKMYRTVQYSNKTADYVQYNNQLITLYKDFTVNIVSVLSKNSKREEAGRVLLN